MFKIELDSYKPLCFINGALYLYKSGCIYSFKNNRITKIIRIYSYTLKESTRITSRLFRAEPKYAVPINDNEILIIGHKIILLLNIEQIFSRRIAVARNGFSDPLNVCPAKERWLALWGDYGPNRKNDVVNIYALTMDYKVEIIFSFKAGEIRHVHNIIPKISGGYYIFTGDQEKHAGIYEADSLLKSVTALNVGKQKFRAVIGFDTMRGLLYATDAVNEKNYIYLLDKEQKINVISKINGSCIYGTKYKSKYVFSTTVEPDENNKGLLSWFSKKRGKGIISDEVHLVEIDEDMNNRIILKLKKDFFPMKLMQYGAIQFPKGTMKELWCYPVAVEKYDGVPIILK